MKKYLYFTSILFAMSMTSCEEKLPGYQDDNSRLNFQWASSADSIVNYSFVYHGNVTKDTVWLTVKTMGMPQNRDRFFSIEQVLTGNNDATANKQFVAFDNTDYKQKLVIPADSVSASIPVVVIRDESLSDDVYTIKVKIKDDSEFLAGYANTCYKVLKITDMLEKPSNWTSLMDHYFGTYGRVKHQFMINISGKNWDEAFISDNGFDSYMTADQAYMTYWQSKFSKALDEENLRRASEGEEPLSESDGTLVDF